MKSYLPFTAAALLLAACSEATSPTATLTPQNTKSPPPPAITVAGNHTSDSYTFEDASISGAGGTGWAEEAIGTAGSIGAEAVTTTEAYNGSTRFLGRASNNALFLVVPNGGHTYDLSFDLYTIGSWDGQGKQAQHGTFGQDIWRLSIRCGSVSAPASAVLLETDFSNQETVQQSYPDGVSQTGGHKAGTGSYAIDGLGFRNDPTVNTPVFRSYGDVEYHMDFTGVNPCPADQTTYFTFVVPFGNLQSNYDESWGLDNVVIKTDS
jgi:hypothetical protein